MTNDNGHPHTVTRVTTKWYNNKLQHMDNVFTILEMRCGFRVLNNINYQVYLHNTDLKNENIPPIDD